LSEINPFGHRLGPVSTRLIDAARNLDNNISNRLRSLLEQNGRLEDIHEEKKMMRFKTEDEKLGKAAVENIKYAYCNIKSVLPSILGVTSEEYDEMINVFGKELKDNDSYLDLTRVYG
ncbi:15479_t:CDS:2, partial [Acaulospora morrowiae]